jgi:hypothetical protein
MAHAPTPGSPHPRVKRVEPYFTIVARKRPAAETRRSRAAQLVPDVWSALVLWKIHVDELPAEDHDADSRPMILT